MALLGTFTILPVFWYRETHITPTAAVCGPPALYACILEQLSALGIDEQYIFATLERRMRCGIGECCHCVVGDTYICQDGPVFSLADLRTMPGAF